MAEKRRGEQDCMHTRDETRYLVAGNHVSGPLRELLAASLPNPRPDRVVGNGLTSRLFARARTSPYGRAAGLDREWRGWGSKEKFGRPRADEASSVLALAFVRGGSHVCLPLMDVVANGSSLPAAACGEKKPTSSSQQAYGAGRGVRASMDDNGILLPWLTRDGLTPWHRDASAPLLATMQSMTEKRAAIPLPSAIPASLDHRVAEDAGSA
ncbi:hypothetical protein RJ55_07291 [Drechmeria coniospora]|nr:hypothetical protein RJ55_07291 [Drechmeria coniospora]